MIGGELVEVINAVIADRVDVASDNKLHIQGVFTDVYPRAPLPCVVPEMYLVAFFEANAAEVGTERLIQGRVMDADSAVLLAFQQPVVVPPPPRSGSRATLNHIVLMQNLVFNRTGNHEVAILVDNDTKRSVPLYVNEPPNEGETE